MDDPGPADVGGGEDHPLAGSVDRWEAVIDAMEATASEDVVLVPLYYRSADAQEMTRRALERGRLELFVRTLSNDRSVVFSQTEPQLLLPESAGE